MCFLQSLRSQQIFQFIVDPFFPVKQNVLNGRDMFRHGVVLLELNARLFWTTVISLNFYSFVYIYVVYTFLYILGNLIVNTRLKNYKMFSLHIFFPLVINYALVVLLLKIETSQYLHYWCVFQNVSALFYFIFFVFYIYTSLGLMLFANF